MFTIFEDALGLPLRATVTEAPPAEAQAKAAGRDEARAARDWAAADASAPSCRPKAGLSRTDPTGPHFAGERLRDGTPPSAGTAMRWTADLQPRWNVGNNPNGGYLLAIAVRAMLRGGRPAGSRDASTAHYLSPPADGPGQYPDPDRQAGPDLRHRHGGGGPGRAGAGAGPRRLRRPVRSNTGRPG